MEGVEGLSVCVFTDKAGDACQTGCGFRCRALETINHMVNGISHQRSKAPPSKSLVLFWAHFCGFGVGVS